MQMSQAETQEYQKNGYVTRNIVFTDEEIAMMIAELDRLSAVKTPDICLEDDGKIRAMHGCHLRSELFSDLTRIDRIVSPAKTLLGEDPVYLHQFKINLKSSFAGQVWPWHQDHAYWHNEDGLFSSQSLTAAIFLDDIDHMNAPICVIPGSHQYGDLTARQTGSGKNKDWRINFGTKPNHVIPGDVITSLSDKHGLVSIIGRKGTTVFFSSLLAHASSQNISPKNRRIIFLAYNVCSNAPKKDFEYPRPDFLCSKDSTPIVQVARLSPLSGK